MKSYEEVTNNLLERRDRYVVEQNRKRKRMMGAATSLCCCCLVAIMGFGVWQSNSGTSTLPPAVNEQLNTPTASEQLNNVDVPNNTTDTNIELNIGNGGNVDTTIWLSADEVLKSAENGSQMGVAVPLLIAYQGTIYGCPTEEYNENSQYALLENEVILRENYSYPAYQVKDISDNVAIILNGRLETYQKLFEIKAVIDGNAYRIVQPMMSGIDYSYGEIIQENEDFTVYQAINVQSGEVMEVECVINILPLLKRELPNFFDGDENYGEAWWLAIPQSND